MRIVQLIQFRSGQHSFPAFHQADGLGNRPRRVGIIARDHYRANTRLARFLQGRRDFHARRINHANQPHKDQILFHLRGGQFAVRDILLHTVGQPQHAQGVGGHGIVGGQDALSGFFVERFGFVFDGLVTRAQGQHHIRRALDDNHIPIFVLVVVEGRDILGTRLDDIVDGNHALAFGIKGNFVLAGVGGFDLLVHLPGLGRGHQQGALRRVADHAKSLALIRRAGRLQLGVVVERAQPEGGQRAGIVGNIRDFSADFEIALWCVAGAGHFHKLPVRPQARDRHLVLRQRAGFIGTDHGGRTQRLDRGQFSDQRVAAHHLAHADGQGNCHHRRQAFRHGRDGQADGDDENVCDLAGIFLEVCKRAGEEFPDVRVVDQRDDEDDRHQRQRADGQRPSQLVEAALERRLLLLHPLEHFGDQAELGPHAGADHHAAPASV